VRAGRGLESYPGQRIPSQADLPCESAARPSWGRGPGTDVLLLFSIPPGVHHRGGRRV